MGAVDEYPNGGTIPYIVDEEGFFQGDDQETVAWVAQEVGPILKRLELRYSGDSKHPVKLDHDQARILFAFIVSIQEQATILKEACDAMAEGLYKKEKEISELNSKKRRLWAPR